MEEPNWSTVDEIVAAAIDHPEADRADYLAEVCAGRPDLRARVESLLRAYEESEGFLEPERNALYEPGAKLGPYRLIQQAGRGGMGSVYRAERDDDQYHQLVAVKVMDVGRLSPAMQRRFREERQILAGLEHINIARLLDGGVGPDGAPYLVMEYVEGIPIDRYAKEKGLTLGERVELFCLICAAVHYSHQRLVVHRDIKPGNILVTADGTPKLLDFGIAKPVTAEGESSGLTKTVLQAMTPDYASPEQIRGAAVSTASDVYSLGVLLYELLVGRRPYDLRDKTLEQVLATVTETPPENPRTGEGDLDAILLKALRKEPAERYASAEAFAADLQRYLHRQPVLARKGTGRYVLGKFMARNKALIAAGSAAVILMAAGVGAILYQSRIAQKRFDDVRHMARFVIFDMYDTLTPLAGSIEARKRLAEEGTRYLDALAADGVGDRKLKVELAGGYMRIGDVLGNQSIPNLGDIPGALRNYEKGRTIAEELAGDAADEESQRLFATVLTRMATVRLMRGWTQQGADESRKAMEMSERLLARNGSTRNQNAVANAYHFIAEYAASKDHAEYLRYRQKSLDIYEALLASDPGNQNLLQSAALEHRSLCSFLVLTKKDLSSNSERHAQRAIELDEQRLRNSPGHRGAMFDVSFDYGVMADLEDKRGNDRNRLAWFEKMTAIRRSLYEAARSDVQAKRGLAYALRNVGASWSDLNQPAKALEPLGESTALIEELRSLDPANVRFRLEAAVAYGEMALAHVALGREARACEAFKKSRAFFDALSEHVTWRADLERRFSSCGR